MTDAATQRQITAADPDRSTWLSANAGSGKTTVLTNRVARLLLHGVRPQNILCLTYTKAAASEMQNRLFKTLGNWAMLDDDDLHHALSELGEPRQNDLSRARTLFARAIDTPGGLKIQTIHSLCSSILRQFPLEAGVSQSFRELDTPQQKDMIAEVLAKLAETNAQSLAGVARFYSSDMSELALDVIAKADTFETYTPKDQIFREFGLPADITAEDVARNAISDEDVAFLKSVVPLLRQGKATDITLAENIEKLPNTISDATFPLAEACFLNGDFRLLRYFITKDLRKAVPDILPHLPALETIRLRVYRAKHTMINIAAAEQALSIQAFARAFLPAYQRAKQDAGVLDFDDLIRKTRALLTRQSLQWVMYRLDGKIDHILVDEAQDTSPLQWDVIEALAEEMASGEGDRPRTLFVVGDKKQSIYSFQGADAAGFEKRAEKFHERLAGGLRPETLEHSFRSSPAILNIVDQVFNADEMAGLGAHHQAFQDGLAGRVDLWPLVEKPETDDDVKWSETGNRLVENDASVRLADAVARKIKDLLENETIPGKIEPKRVEPGDIMILVQRRSKLFDQIIQACKREELEIAGADRLKLGSELAVRDLLALLSFLTLPDDDLSLAAALRSPLFGWTEKQLYDLAAERQEKRLWAELRRKGNEYPETLETLFALRKGVDFARPFELLETILTRFQGRERLLARLGPEAEDGIDELLNQALVYERSDIPSLTGFLSAARASDVEVKRQAGNAGNQIRVMTVHGAKGLESPIVILPDTTFEKRDQGGNLIEADGMAVYTSEKKLNPPKVADARARKREADLEERNRLLYVAMTRAEKWLIVCGIDQGAQKASWHQTISVALERAGAGALDTDFGEGLRYSFGDWPNSAEIPVLETKKAKVSRLLDFGRVLAKSERKSVISPSELPGAKALGGEGRNEEDAKRRGRQIHLLLEHLPTASDPEGVARNLLLHGADAASEADLPGLLAEARGVLAAHPDVFRPQTLAEVSIVGSSPTLKGVVSGVIDRLIVSETEVHAIDFKTNAVVPKTPEKTPDGILRQMGAYLEALEDAYPDREITLSILWTATSDLMQLPHSIVRSALQAPPTS